MSGRKRAAGSAETSVPAASSAPAKAKKLRTNDLTTSYLNTMAATVETNLKGEARTWDDLGMNDKEACVVAVTRYCIMKWCSGAGYIEESEIKKMELQGISAVPKAALTEAMRRLRDAFGLELVDVWKVVDGDGPEVKNIDKGKYMLRIPPTFCDEETMVKLAESSCDGLAVEQRGLLFVVLALILLDPHKAIREDHLFTQLGELDPAAFGPGSVDPEAEESLANWPKLLRTTFTKMKYLERKPLKGDAAETAAATQEAPSTGEKASATQAYSFGPRSRHVIGSPMILQFITRITGAAPSSAQLNSALGKEAVGLVDVLKEESSDEEPEPAKGAGAKAGATRSSGRTKK